MTGGEKPRLGPLLLVLSGNMLIDALEVSTSVVAMPAIANEFSLTPAWASSVMVAFALGFGGFIIIGGRLVSRFGRRRVYLLATLVFAIASVVGGLAVNMPMLLASRVVKGICVALTAPTGLAIIGTVFSSGFARQRALSIYTIFGACGFSVGLALSGVLTAVSWRWAMLFSGPVAFLLFIAAYQLVPSTSQPVVADAPASASASPMLAFRPLMRNRQLWGSAVGGAVLNGSFWGFLLVATFEWQQGLSWSPQATGLALLPASLPLVLSSRYSSRLVSRFGAQRLIAAGGIAAAVGYAYYLTRDSHETYSADVLPTVLLIGFAFSVSFYALNMQAISSSPPSRQQIAGGIFQTAVQLGGVMTILAISTLTDAVSQPALFIVLAIAVLGGAFALSRIASLPAKDREESHA